MAAVSGARNTAAKTEAAPTVAQPPANATRTIPLAIFPHVPDGALGEDGGEDKAGSGKLLCL